MKLKDRKRHLYFKRGDICNNAVSGNSVPRSNLTVKFLKPNYLKGEPLIIYFGKKDKVPRSNF